MKSSLQNYKQFLQSHPICGGLLGQPQQTDTRLKEKH